MVLRIKLASMYEQRIYNMNYIQNTFEYNGSEIEKDIRDFYIKIMELIKPWPKRLENLQIVDGLICEISYREKGEEQKLYFQNKFPENFDELLDVLEVVLND